MACDKPGAINCGFRDRILVLVCEGDRQFAGRQVCLFQDTVDDFACHFARNAVPNVFGLGRSILEACLTAQQVSVVPAAQSGHLENMETQSAEPCHRNAQLAKKGDICG